MNKFRYLQSYELLSIVLKIYREENKIINDILAEIAEILDKHFDSTDFQSIRKSDSFSGLQTNTEEDNLFLDFKNIQLQYSNLNILTSKEKISIFACALCWFRQFNFPEANIDLLERILSLEKELVAYLVGFFNETDKNELAELSNMFTLKNVEDDTEELEGGWIESNKPERFEDEDYYMLTSLPSPLKVLYIQSLKIFVIRCLDSEVLFRKNNKTSLFGWEFLGPGDFINVDDGVILDYYDLKNRYLKQNCIQKLEMSIENLSYTYASGKGIKSFSLSAEPGTLSGVIGVEGSGKSIFLRLLAGEITGTAGDIIINGYSLRKDLYLLKGIIGFVPEDDLLFNELTAYENLYLTAQLYLGRTSKETIQKKLDKLLIELDLDHIRNTIVGSINDKFLQPGQRRLLNIALELLRDPPILIVDNALTPLSQSDSSKIIEVLTNYSYKGKIVFTSITQTDLDTFACFDKIFVMDEGGFPVYYGKIKEAWHYFSELFELPVNEGERIGPESIIHLINTKRIGSNQKYMHRYFSPLELYNKNVENSESRKKVAGSWKLLPENLLHPPTLDRQYRIFNLRNFKTKLAGTRELIYTVLIAPVLAILLSVALHESSTGSYSFSTNKNIPDFFFISILFAILFGLLQSVNEIFKERNIIRKQEYLNLSRFSYINAKITYLFIIGIIQSFFYLLIASLILEIRNVFLVNWLILFSSFSFGILLGLIISNTHRSLEFIYARSVPIVIILQLLFGGGFIDNNSNGSNSKNYTMIFSDLMVARWGYEATMVNQFRNNAFQKNFYDLERMHALSELNTMHLLPLMNSQLAYCSNHYEESSDTLNSIFQSLVYCMEMLVSNHDIFPYENIDKLTPEEFNEEIADDALEYLEYLEYYFTDLLVAIRDERVELTQRLTDSMGIEKFNMLKSNNYNYTVADAVLKENHGESFKYNQGIPIQLDYPIYQFPQSDLGRAQMFVPEKQFSGERVDTIEFNISIIWLINLFLYILLIINLRTRTPSYQRK